MAEKNQFSGFSIEPRAEDGELVAILRFRQPLTNYLLLGGGRGEAIQKIGLGFNESALAARVANIEKTGEDAALSRAALASLRAAKAVAKPQPNTPAAVPTERQFAEGGASQQQMA